MSPRPQSGLSTVGYLALLAVLGLGASTAWFAIQARTAEAKLRQAGTSAEPASASQPADDSSLRGQLWARDAEVSRLRAENGALRARLLGASAAPPAAHDAGGPARPWLEQLKARDPERYKKMMERREQARIDHANEIHTQLASLAERLEALPAEGRTPREQKQAELLTQLETALQQLAQLGDKFQEARQLPEDQRGPAIQSLAQQRADLYGQIVALKQQDRQMQLENLAGQVGISADSTSSFVSQVNQIVKDTQPPSRRGFGGPGGGAGGGGSGGGAGGGGSRGGGAPAGSGT